MDDEKVPFLILKSTPKSKTVSDVENNVKLASFELFDFAHGISHYTKGTICVKTTKIPNRCPSLWYEINLN